GTGIDEAEKDKLFKPFITAKKEGTGIGLVICRSIIEDHNGKIWAENMPEGGAKFSFSLKLLKDG
ncbi:MAG: PAS domain-containing sensor histidine kinase, partial [Ignavibacteriaceae bacterium]|nr:PAS domain-containing sensor histidine kinase [Ignavibacteriaceae bacterium]